LAPRRGMGRLVERLVEALQEKGVNFVRAKVTGLKGQDQAGVTLEPGGSFGGVVVATPAAEAAGLLRRPCPGAAADLATIRSASVTLVTFAYQASALRIPAGSSGLLVPRGEG